MLDHLLRVRMLLCLLLAHLLLLLIGYLLLNVLVLESALSGIVRAARGGMLMVKRLDSRGSLTPIVDRLGKMVGLSNGALRDVVSGRPLLASSGSGVLGPVVGATFSSGCLPGLLCGMYTQARQE
jgi:hypothetical protein